MNKISRQNFLLDLFDRGNWREMRVQGFDAELYISKDARDVHVKDSDLVEFDQALILVEADA